METEDAESASQELGPQRRQQQLIAGHMTQQQQRYPSRQLQSVVGQTAAEQPAENAAEVTAAKQADAGQAAAAK